MSTGETLLYRALEVAEIRDLDAKARRATFVATTENPVRVPGGVEVLRMAGAQLDRFRANPVLLDAHHRDTVTAVLGHAETVTVDGRRLLAQVVFDPTPEGQAAWARVEAGSLRAVSIGYTVEPEHARLLAEGEGDGEGEARVMGPAFVAGRWTLYELSLVPIPADQDALKHELAWRSVAERGGRVDSKDSKDEKKAEPPKDEKKAEPPKDELLPEEREARIERARADKRAALDQQIRALPPPYLQDVAEDAILSGLDLEGARKLILDARAKRSRPSGTPEPQAPPAAGQSQNKWPEQVTNDVLLSTVRNLS